MTRCFGYNESILFSSSGTVASPVFKGPVATFTDLSTIGTPSVTPPPIPGETRVVLDEDIAYIYDDATDTWVASGGTRTPFSVTFNKAGVTGAVFLDNGGIVSNESPFVVPFNATIVAISAASDVAADWKAQVYKNAVVRAGLPPLVASVTELVISPAADSGQVVSLSVNVNAGDEIGLFCRPGPIAVTVTSPSATIFFSRRA